MFVHLLLCSRMTSPDLPIPYVYARPNEVTSGSSGNVACREERATRVETPLFMVTTAIRLHPGLSQKTNVRAKRVLGRPIADGY